LRQCNGIYSCLRTLLNRTQPADSSTTMTKNKGGVRP
jgi:hypothetical protein